MPHTRDPLNEGVDPEADAEWMPVYAVPDAAGGWHLFHADDQDYIAFVACSGFDLQDYCAQQQWQLLGELSAA